MRPGKHRLLSLAIIFITLWLLVRFLLPLTLPFWIGTGLAALAQPMARFLRRQLRLNRRVASFVAVSMTFCFLTIAALLLLALIIRELGLLAGVIPDLARSAKSGVAALENWLLELVGQSVPGLRPVVRSLFSGGTSLLERVLEYFLNLAGTILTRLPDSALGVGTAILSGYMVSAKYASLRRWLLKALPREKLRPLVATLKSLKNTVLRWLLAQVQLSGVTFGLLLICFLLLRIPYAPLWALAVAVLDALPVLGTGTVLLPWSLVALLQGNGALALGLLGGYVTVCVVRSVLEPRLLGSKLGLDPLLTLLALYAGYKLWGIGGMLLSPLLAVTAVQLLPAGSSGE